MVLEGTTGWPDIFRLSHGIMIRSGYGTLSKSRFMMQTWFIHYNTSRHILVHFKNWFWSFPCVNYIIYMVNNHPDVIICTLNPNLQPDEQRFTAINNVTRTCDILLSHNWRAPCNNVWSWLNMFSQIVFQSVTWLKILR